ncbi:adhesive plaque matrix protein-like [Paramacrobiotus metropolitanus]|uniref:adhesive plaque matrix protein-like n=1 Tax=Paramacrobiotus metropolitanus TaxID=2943436 RepID=UPI002445A78A|nr:adhesive plaque matrix protein-like [Paramacrobiotus metropolitanus]
MFKVVLGFLPLISPLWADVRSNSNATNAQQPAVIAGNSAEVEPIVAAASGYGYQSKPYSSYYGSSYSGGLYSDSQYGGGCYGKPVGYRGDPSYDCKVFDVCQSDGRFDRFYCPDYTRFNNYLSICDWADKVDSYCNPIYPYNNDDYSYGYETRYNGYEKPKYGSSYKPSYEPPQYYLPKFEYPKYEPVYAYKEPRQSSYGEYNSPPKYEHRYADYHKESYAPVDYGKYTDNTYSAEYKVGYDKVYEPTYDSPYVPNFLTKKY